MPLARIDLVAGKPAAYRRTIGDVVYEAMLVALNVPRDDRFQIISEHPAENLIADENYLGIRRTRDCVFIQVTLRGGRTLDQKKAFYKAVADGLHAKLNLRREDVFISLVENTKDDWSFGNGLATYAT
jgi:4-oxalocrotonate tautomerase